MMTHEQEQPYTQLLLIMTGKLQYQIKHRTCNEIFEIYKNINIIIKS